MHDASKYMNLTMSLPVSSKHRTRDGAQHPASKFLIYDFSIHLDTDISRHEIPIKGLLLTRTLVELKDLGFQ